MEDPIETLDGKWKDTLPNTQEMDEINAFLFHKGDKIELGTMIRKFELMQYGSRVYISKFSKYVITPLFPSPPTTPSLTLEIGNKIPLSF